MILAALLAAGLNATPVSAHRDVTTTVPLAQSRFDTALTELFAYAGPQAAVDFDAAALSDPHLAVAFWGKALAEGSDLNDPLTEAAFGNAAVAAKQAQALEAYASRDERQLIDAIAKRYAGTYADRTSDEAAYEAAMESYLGTHPNDDDAAMLLVEALLEGHDMAWNADGTPRDAVSAEMLRLTQTVLAHTPQHLLANHLCIHLYDRAHDRSAAIPCAQRLDAMTFAPADEHLAHMPAHLWLEIGDARLADASSERAWSLNPTHYAEHDAAVGLLAAFWSGDRERVVAWEERYKPFGDPSRFLSFTVLRADMTLIRAAQADEQRGQIDAAVTALQTAIAYQRTHLDSELVPAFPADERLGALYFRAGRYDDAAAAFSDALSYRPDDPHLLFGMWQTLLQQGQTDKASAYEARYHAGWAGDALTMQSF